MKILQLLVPFSMILAVKCERDNDVARITAKDSSATLTKKPFTDECLNCIYETINCTGISKCMGDICGPFSINRSYWKDAGYPTVLFDDKESDGAFERCANDLDCAGHTVKKYMETHPYDCNNDTIIDCYDYGAIHLGDTYKCTSPMSRAIEERFSKCLSKMKS